MNSEDTSIFKNNISNKIVKCNICDSEECYISSPICDYCDNNIKESLRQYIKENTVDSMLEDIEKKDNRISEEVQK